MGDAGPLAAEAEAAVSQVVGRADETERRREVNVLVTGFGPFKSFMINPSWLIASALPSSLALTLPDKHSPTGTTHIKINLHIYPSAIPVSYHTVSTVIPPLLQSPAPNGAPYDHIIHIGMAGGRNYYSLETLAHRSGYKIPDIDGLDGYNEGERRWKDAEFSPRGPAPEVLKFAYDEKDAWARWYEDVNGVNPLMVDDEEEQDPSETVAVANDDANGSFDTVSKPTTTPLPTSTPSSSSSSNSKRNNKKARTNPPTEEIDIRISHDAGHFLCEFIFFTSLSELWKRQQPSSSTPAPAPEVNHHHQHPLPLLKVTFLHVPGSTDPAAIKLGTRVAEGLIRGIVGSWEEQDQK